MRYVRAALICLVCSLAMALPVRAEGGQTSFFDSINAVLSGFDVGIGGTVITSEYKDTRLAGSTLPLLGYEGEYFYLRGVSTIGPCAVLTTATQACSPGSIRAS